MEHGSAHILLTVHRGCKYSCRSTESVTETRVSTSELSDFLSGSLSVSLASRIVRRGARESVPMICHRRSCYAGNRRMANTNIEGCYSME